MEWVCATLGWIVAMLALFWWLSARARYREVVATWKENHNTAMHERDKNWNQATNYHMLLDKLYSERSGRTAPSAEWWLNLARFLRGKQAGNEEQKLVPLLTTMLGPFPTTAVDLNLEASVCPHCGEEIETRGLLQYLGPTRSFREQKCEKCGQHWQDEFTMTRRSRYDKPVVPDSEKEDDESDEE